MDSEITGGMKRIGDILPKATLEKSRKTERGELMRYFQKHLNYARANDNLPKLTMARIGKILEGIPTQDLYYLQSVCAKAKNFSKKFWWEIDPKKHMKEHSEQPF
jgi:hypothetical protein